MTPIRIDVRHAGGRYPVLVGYGLLERLGRILEIHEVPAPSLIVSARPIWRHHGRRLGAFDAAQEPALIPDGERAKTLDTVRDLYSRAARRRMDRRSTVLAFGGGVVGDIAGFAAATYLRGVPLIHVPTTLLAQVDSAVGGKVGVNLPAGKNLVGAFHAPVLVACDPGVLSTLPAREFRAGLFEVIKYGVIASARLFGELERGLDALMRHEPAALTRVVAACCRIKAGIVGRDERESGPRRLLNFGHTVGHALEAVTSYRRFKHGEAVAWGMLAALHVSLSHSAIDARAAHRIDALIRRVGPLPRVTDLRSRDVLRAMRLDKKHVAGQLHFVLAAGIGSARVATDVTPQDLAAALAAIGIS